jgi:hypothetical protein
MRLSTQCVRTITSSGPVSSAASARWRDAKDPALAAIRQEIADREVLCLVAIRESVALCDEQGPVAREDPTGAEVVPSAHLRLLLVGATIPINWACGSEVCEREGPKWIKRGIAALRGRNISRPTSLTSGASRRASTAPFSAAAPVSARSRPRGPSLGSARRPLRRTPRSRGPCGFRRSRGPRRTGRRARPRSCSPRRPR